MRHPVLQAVGPGGGLGGHGGVVVESVPEQQTLSSSLGWAASSLTDLLNMLNILSPPTARKGALIPLISAGLIPPNLTSISASPTTSLAQVSSLKFVPKE